MTGKITKPSKLKILHVEDLDLGKRKDYAAGLRNVMKGLFIKNVGSLDGFYKENISEYTIFLLDGQFPAKEGAEPDVKSFLLAVQYLLEKGVKKNRIIVWSNSTRVHKVASEMGLEYFSKKELSDEHYIKKGIDPKYKAKMADEKKISELIDSAF